ncbi:hypothetical protein [Emticicia fontis]
MSGLIYLALFVIFSAFIAGNNKDFNPNLWKDDFEGETRSAMISDLEKEHLKKGMTKDEVTGY